MEAGSAIGVLVEVDTGMHRCGADSPEEALAVARAVDGLPGLRMDGLSGYEGHCSLEMDTDLRHEKQAAAMRYFVEVADHLEANGIPCPILSAAGTATAFWTGANPRHHRAPAWLVRGDGRLSLPDGAALQEGDHAQW